MNVYIAYTHSLLKCILINYYYNINICRQYIKFQHRLVITFHCIRKCNLTLRLNYACRIYVEILEIEMNTNYML